MAAVPQEAALATARTRLAVAGRLLPDAAEKLHERHGIDMAKNTVPPGP